MNRTLNKPVQAPQRSFCVAQSPLKLDRLPLGHKHSLSTDAKCSLSTPGDEHRPASSCGLRDVRSPLESWVEMQNTTLRSRASQGFLTTPGKPSMTESRASSRPATGREDRYSQSTCAPSLSSHDRPRSEDDVASSEGKSEKDKRRLGASRWFRHVKDWVSISEPSTQAMKEERTKMQKRRGLDTKVPNVDTSFHYPGGQIPPGVITSTTGPRPEKALQSINRDRELRKSYLPTSPTSHSLSSFGSWSPSAREPNPVAPWDSER